MTRRIERVAVLGADTTGNRFVGAIDMAIAQFDPMGTRLRYVTETLDMKLNSKTYSAMRTEGLEFSKTVKLLPEAVEVRIAIRDLGSGQVGSVVIPLTRVQLLASKKQ